MTRTPRLDRTVEELVRLARGARRQAHAPYSDFRVGVVLEDTRGRRYLGANFENASFPLGVCAERVALMIWRAEAGSELRSIVIYTDTGEPTSPCGLCRDALRRWAPDAVLRLAWRGGVSEPWRIEDLVCSSPADGEGKIG